MTGIAVDWAPVVPERPATGSDRAWIDADWRRSSAARMRPGNLVAAAGAGSQNGQLGRSWTEGSLSAERRRTSRSAARRIVSQGGRDDDELIAAYRATRRDMEPILRRAALRGMGTGRAVADPGHAGDDCQVCRAEAVARGEFTRSYALEDIHVMRSAGGDGRMVEAYAAVFGQEAKISDFEGHYSEVIDPGAFNAAIAVASRARGGFAGQVKVLYNHGLMNDGSQAERFQIPIGVPVEIRADTRGLLTRTRYSETPLADEVLENIRNGSITAQSFTGRIVRSDPQLRRGDRRRPDIGGRLPVVRRMELGLREYGPVLWPAYTGAEIVGVRGRVMA